MATTYLAPADPADGDGEPELKKQFPHIFGFLAGAFGKHPDELAGSVLDENSQKSKAAAEFGYPIGLAAQMLPFGKGVASAEGVATGGKAAQGGMLRWGGRDDLILSHGTNSEALLRRTGPFGPLELLPELDNMSLALQKGQIGKTGFGEATTTRSGVVLVPRVGKFDPRTSPSVIHTRDAWTPGYDDSAAGKLRRLLNKPPNEPLGSTEAREIAKARLNDRFVHRFPKGGLNAVAEPDGGALGSRRFNSFKAYENSPQGADALSHVTSKQSQQASFKLQQFLNAIDNKAVDDMTIRPEALSEIMQAPGRQFQSFDKFEMFKALRENPASYAELKNFGPTQLNGDNFAAALITQPRLQSPRTKIMTQSAEYERLMEQEDRLMELLQRKGITPVRARTNPAEAFIQASELQKARR